MRFSHPNAKGTGVEMNVMLGRRPIEIAFSACDGDGMFQASFFLFDAVDIARIIAVIDCFEDEVKEGKGMFQTIGDVDTRLYVKHKDEPTDLYEFTICMTQPCGDTIAHSIALNHYEALALRHALVCAIGRMEFGGEE